ncbi:MAG: hypothetical protein H7125_09450 [Proteobacteria bacterium]|nr:hypothetical protein [Burkholderiales bacterium]
MSCKLLDYPARGVYGFRVVRRIGGQVYDEFYSLIDRRRRAGGGSFRYARLTGAAYARVQRTALQRDAALSGMQRVYRAYEAAQAQPQVRAAGTTTVRGIRFCRNRPGRRPHLAPAPGFLVSVVVGGRRASRFFMLPEPLEERTWRDTWVSAVSYLAEVKRLRDWASLLEREPDMRLAFNEVRRNEMRRPEPDSTRRLEAG